MEEGFHASPSACLHDRFEQDGQHAAGVEVVLRDGTVTGSTSVTLCPSARRPSTYCSTAHAAPAWPGWPATMPATMIES